MKQVELLRTATSEQAYLCRNALQVMAVDWSCQRNSRMYSVTAVSIKSVAMEDELMRVLSSVCAYHEIRKLHLRVGTHM